MRAAFSKRHGLMKDLEQMRPETVDVLREKENGSQRKSIKVGCDGMIG